MPLRLAQRYRELYLFLLNKWYFDELYDLLFVRPAMRARRRAVEIGRWRGSSTGLGPNGIAALTRDLARQASRLQTGYLYHYAFVMMIGLAAFVTWYLLPALPSEAAFVVSHWPLLSLVTFVPLVGVAFLLMTRGEGAVVARNARFIALWTTLVDFALSVVLWIEFNPNTAQFQFVERARWVNLGGFTISYHMGIDGISLFFILLSTLLTLLSIIASWDIIQVRVREYMIAFLVLETLLVGLFCALDFVLFYVFFEGVLIPMFLIIGIWGGENTPDLFGVQVFSFLPCSAFGIDAVVGDPWRLGSTCRPGRPTFRWR